MEKIKPASKSCCRTVRARDSGASPANQTPLLTHLTAPSLDVWLKTPGSAGESKGKSPSASDLQLAASCWPRGWGGTPQAPALPWKDPHPSSLSPTLSALSQTYFPVQTSPSLVPLPGIPGGQWGQAGRAQGCLLGTPAYSLCGTRSPHSSPRSERGRAPPSGSAGGPWDREGALLPGTVARFPPPAVEVALTGSLQVHLPGAAPCPPGLRRQLPGDWGLPTRQGQGGGPGSTPWARWRGRAGKRQIPGQAGADQGSARLPGRCAG